MTFVVDARKNRQGLFIIRSIQQSTFIARKLTKFGEMKNLSTDRPEIKISFWSLGLQQSAVTRSPQAIDRACAGIVRLTRLFDVAVIGFCLLHSFHLKVKEVDYLLFAYHAIFINLYFTFASGRKTVRSCYVGGRLRLRLG